MIKFAIVIGVAAMTLTALATLCPVHHNVSSYAKGWQTNAKLWRV